MAEKLVAQGRLAGAQRVAQLLAQATENRRPVLLCAHALPLCPLRAAQSTVSVLLRLRGKSGSMPRATLMW